MSHRQIDTSQANGPAILNVPDPEVVVKAPRRQFTAEWAEKATNPCLSAKLTPVRLMGLPF